MHQQPGTLVHHVHGAQQQAALQGAGDAAAREQLDVKAVRICRVQHHHQVQC